MMQITSGDFWLLRKSWMAGAGAIRQDRRSHDSDRARLGPALQEVGPEGLATRRAPGRASILNDEQRAGLAETVEAGPIPAAHGAVRWRLADLAQRIWGEFRVSVTRYTFGASCVQWAYRKLSARPHDRGQKPDDRAIFKKEFVAPLAQIKRRLPRGTR